MKAFAMGLAAVMLFLGCGDDDGPGDNQNGNSDQAVCGNGTVETGEVCDDGAANSDSSPDACRTDCRGAWCGDAVVDTGETCDDGGANSDYLANACRKSCQEASCGDGTVDRDEQCDDANTDPGDGCATDCQVEPFWDCADRPSQCACVPYHRGPDCLECVVYVDVSSTTSTPDGLAWSTAYTRVQQGIDAADAAGPNCEVWVAEGTYYVYEFSPTNTVSLLDHVAVYGGFLGTETQRAERDWETNETILEGRGPGFDRLYHVVEAISTVDATLDGFTITGGSAFGEDTPDRRGGGVTTKGSRITVANCTIWGNRGFDGSGMANEGSQVEVHNVWFVDNRSSGRGGAMFHHGGSLVMTDTVFTTNEAHVLGGALYASFANLTMSGCAFSDNWAADSGGAIFGSGAWMTISDTDFIGNYLTDPSAASTEGNRGGALYAHQGAQTLTNCLFDSNVGALGGGLATSGAAPTLSRCTFTGNEAWEHGGAIYTIDGSQVIESSLIANNLAGENGGGVYSESSDSTLVGCTVANNFAILYGGGLSNSNGNAALTNCIVWGNTAGTHSAINTYTFPLNPIPAQTLLLHNDLQGGGIPPNGSDEGGNIFVDPDFLNAANGDYHLDALSPCVDAGWGDASVPLLDRDGNGRVDLGQSGAHNGAGTPNYVDLGAFERQN